MEEVKGQGNNIRATRDVRRSQSSCSYCLSVVDFLSLNFIFLSVQSFLYVLHSLSAVPTSRNFTKQRDKMRHKLEEKRREKEINRTSECVLHS